MPAVAICILSGMLLSSCHPDTVIDQSLRDWNKMEKKVEKKAEQLKGPEKAILLDALHNLDSLRHSIQHYGLQYIDTSPGFISYDIPHDIIYFNIQRHNVANFIHEATHGGQFQRGEIVFRDTLVEGQKTVVDGVGDDLDNEIEAYRAQFAFDPASVADLPDDFRRPASLDDLTSDWLLGLIDNDRHRRLYLPNGRYGIATMPVNIYSTKQDMEAAYPLADCMKQLSANYILGNDSRYLNYPAKWQHYWLTHQTERALLTTTSFQPLSR